MQYRLSILNRAKRDLRGMPPELARSAGEMILELATDPFPPDARALARELQGRYRIRVDGWRIIYLVNETDKSVKILAVRPRDERTYLNLP